jgi:hypothetical protein
MTIAMLMKNTIKAARMRRGFDASSRSDGQHRHWQKYSGRHVRRAWLLFDRLGQHYARTSSTGQAVHGAVIDEFGKQIVAPDGTIDRRKLGGIVLRILLR